MIRTRDVSGRTDQGLAARSSVDFLLNMASSFPARTSRLDERAGERVDQNLRVRVPKNQCVGHEPVFLVPMSQEHKPGVSWHCCGADTGECGVFREVWGFSRRQVSGPAPSTTATPTTA